MDEEFSPDVSAYEELERAVEDFAMGNLKHNVKKAIKKTDEVGNVVQTQIMMANDLPANPAMLRYLMDKRIGGPQDWC